MGYALTATNKIYVPDEVKFALGVQIGEMIDYEVKPNGQVFIIAAKQTTSPNIPVKPEK